jgi:hypothetical protein
MMLNVFLISFRMLNLFPWYWPLFAAVWKTLWSESYELLESSHNDSTCVYIHLFKYKVDKTQFYSITEVKWGTISVTEGDLDHCTVTDKVTCVFPFCWLCYVRWYKMNKLFVAILCPSLCFPVTTLPVNSQWWLHYVCCNFL